MTKHQIIRKNEKKQIIIRESGNYVVELVGEGASVQILGGFHIKGSEKEEIRLIIIHKAKHTKADTLLKAVVEDSGEIEIRGKIIVEDGAQQTESYLQERVLLLSTKARATAIPDLEIKANEVKCSHAATISNINEEQVFYLMSRGIERKKAKNILVEGFLEEVWGKIHPNTN